MEIKPLKEYALPKFALALTVATVASTITACGSPQSYETLNVGNSETASTETQETETASEGMETTTEETTETTEETTEEKLTEEETPETLIVNYELTSPGTGPAYGYEELEESNREAGQVAKQYEAEFIEGFRQQDVELTPEGEYYLTSRTDEQEITILFFNGQAEIGNQTIREYYQNQAYFGTVCWFDWGYVSKSTTEANEYVNAHTYIDISIDIQNCGDITAELIEKIAQEALQ